MRSAERKKIQWSPHNNNQFVVAGNDLRLYEIRAKEGKVPRNDSSIVFRIEDPADPRDQQKKLVYLTGVNTELQNLKCLDWCLDATNPHLLAVGQSTGRVMLTTIIDEPADKLRKEFTPRQSRTCNTVVWNPVLKNIFAAGLDKVRSDFSCLVWDINQGGSTQSGTGVNEPVVAMGADNSYNLSSIVATEKVERPLRQFANSEAIVALAWLPSAPTALAAGTGSRWLRIYDLRDPLKPLSSVGAHTKTVNGVCFDPYRDNLLATFSEENVIKLWDIRKFKDPVLTLNTGSKVVQVGWCPTRGMGILASIGKDEKNIKLWDVKTGILVSDQMDDPKSSSKRLGFLLGDYVEPPKNMKMYTTTVYDTAEPLASFSWHPKRSKLLTINSSSVVEVINIHESLPLAFSPHQDLVFAFGKDPVEAFMNPIDSADKKSEILKGHGDISIVMRERAKAGYGGDPKINRELSAIFGDPELAYVWNWVYDMKYNLSKGKLQELKGIYSIIFGSKTSSKRETATDQGTQFNLFTSPERAFCLRLCGWGFQSDEDMLNSLNVLVQENRVEKAIALAVFHMNIKLAITLISQLEATKTPAASTGATTTPSLSSSGTFLLSNPTLVDTPSSTPTLTPAAVMTLKLVGMALAGFSDGGGALWRASCEPLRHSVTDPYLNAVFSFLSNSKPDYWTVLVESEMSLRDKIAFACRFLDDDRLRQFLERTKVQLISQGRLNGLLLTGIDGLGGGIDLLQQFVNRTADLQTVALLCCHVSHRKLKDFRVQVWVHLYRNMLDRWQLWTQRAKLDVERGSVFELKPPAQVYLRCNYCNQSITLGRDERSAGPGGAPGTPGGSGGAMMGRGPMGGMFGSAASRRPGGGPETKSKITSCPSCRKPLPKCAICLLPLTATPPTTESRQSSDGGSTWHSGHRDFDDWFMWCQTCRHGGHAGHLTEWFRFTDECPVSDCKCKCQYMDRANTIPSTDPTALIGEPQAGSSSSSSSSSSLAIAPNK